MNTAGNSVHSAASPGSSVHKWPRELPAPPKRRLLATALELLFALLVAALVASAWRGAWLVLDATLLTQHPKWSAGGSLLIGFAMLVAQACVQPWLGALARQRPSRAWWLADALYSYVGLWTCVFVWRGAWQLWDHALAVGFPPQPVDDELARGAWLSHGVGAGLLLCVDALRSLNAPPMIYVADSESPIFGARTTPGLHGLTWLGRFARPPPVQEEGVWRASLGLPQVRDADVALRAVTLVSRLKALRRRRALQQRAEAARGAASLAAVA